MPQPSSHFIFAIFNTIILVSSIIDAHNVIHTRTCICRLPKNHETNLETVRTKLKLMILRF